MNLILVDALMGNDYTVCLANALYNEKINIVFISPANRIFNDVGGFEIKKWMPPKDNSKNKFGKVFNYFKFLYKTTNLVLLTKKRIVHFQFLRLKSDILLIILLRLLGIRIVYTAHNIFPHDKKKYDYYLYYLLYKTVNKIIIHSETTKKNLLKYYNLPSNKLHVIPHGNFDFYVNDNPISHHNARQKFNLKDNDKVLLFFGQIRDYKGLDLLIDSMKIVLNAERNIFLIIGGAPASEKEAQEYMKMIDSIGHQNNIIVNFNFIPKEEVESYFKAADFVVLPYKKIDHSGVVHLAYSFNKPIIATNVGDFEEVIIDNETGYIVKSQDPKEFAEKIIYAFNNYECVERMSKNISELNKNKFSWTAIAKKTKELYESI